MSGEAPSVARSYREDGVLLLGLRRRREDFGMSLLELEDGSGLRTEFIHDLENGRKKATGPNYQRMLAQALRVPPRALEVPGESALSRRDRLELALKVSYRPGVSDRLPYGVAGDLRPFLGVKSAHDVVDAVEDALVALGVQVERDDAEDSADREVAFVDARSSLFFAASPSLETMRPVTAFLAALAEEPECSTRGPGGGGRRH